MPIYEYRCACGARLEAIERVGAVRDRCGELCVHAEARPGLVPGAGAVERQLSTGAIRGDGHEAKEPVFSPCARARRPGGGCDGCE